MKTLLLLFLLLPLAAAANDTAYNHLITTATISSSPANTCAAVIISGKEGWKGNVTAIAQRIFKEQNCTVIGIDLNRYLQDFQPRELLCPCADFVRAALYFEKMRGLKKFFPPVLVGYREGSSFAYLALAQDPSCFAGLLTFGFCPDIPGFQRPCKLKRPDYKRVKDIDGFTVFASDLEKPIVVIGGANAGKCSTGSVRDYLKSIPSASMLPEEKDWMPAFQHTMDLIAKQARPPATVLPDLPLIEYPSSHNNTMIIILCGDGGFIDMGRDLAESFSGQKYAVVGWDTLQYYWQKRDPQSSAADMARLIDGYLAAWKKQKVLLIGYSYGADVLPFMLHDMPEAALKRVVGAVLIGPATKTEFEFNVAELQQESGPPEGRPIEPQLKKMEAIPVLCIGGDREQNSLCRKIQKTPGILKDVEVVMLETGHSFGDDSSGIAEKIRHEFLP